MIKDFDVAHLEIADHVAIFTLDHQSRRNAMGPAMVQALREALEIIVEPAHAVRCMLLTGAGRAFCSGGDMAETHRLTTALQSGGEKNTHYTLELHHHPVIRRLRDLPFPLITAINGPAIGMGLSYALLGDLILAAHSAYFQARFVKVGMSCDVGLSWNLPRRIGATRAQEMLLLGEKITAEQALNWGLINRVYADETFREESIVFAKSLAMGPTQALSRLRKLSMAGASNNFDEQLTLEEHYQTELGFTDDAAEGFRAFLEKRAPAFQGR